MLSTDPILVIFAVIYFSLITDMVIGKGDMVAKVDEVFFKIYVSYSYTNLQDKTIYKYYFKWTQIIKNIYIYINN